VFLALLADALVDEAEAAAPSSCRCPMVPVIHRPTVSPESPAMRFAAGVQMLLADQFLADRAADGKRGYQAARGLLSGNVSTARALLDDLGVNLDALRGFEDQQVAAEVPGVTGPAEAAEPTARALGVVFEQIVNLPGASFRTRSGGTRRALAALGQAVGRVIYLTDALDDLRKDFLDGAFNPCLALEDGRLALSETRVDEATGLLWRSLAQIGEALGALPVLRHGELLANILTEQLRREGNRAARKARAWVTPAGRTQIVAWRDAGLWSRTGQSVLWAMAFLMAWLGQLPQVFAQTSLKDRLKEKAKEKLGLDGGVSPPSTTAPLVLPDGGLDAGVPRLDAGVPRLDAGVLPTPPRKPPGLGGGLPSLDAGLPSGGGGASGGSGSSAPDGAACVREGCHSSCACCGVDKCIGGCIDGCADMCCKSTDGCLKGCCSGINCDGCCNGINCNGCCNGMNCNGCCK